MITGILAVAVIVLDRAVKLWVQATLMHSASGRPLIPGVIRLIYAENTGMAFGMLSGQTLLLAVITLGILLFAFFALKRYTLSAFVKVALGLALGGALGNLFDRVMYGFVVDMFDFEFISFAVFNVADAAVCVGMVLMAISLLFRASDWEVVKREQ